MSDAVLAKVKKLFALGESPNEAEALAAIEKAHELLKLHNLDIMDIKEDSKYGIIEDSLYSGVNESRWKSYLAMGVSEANFCTVFKRSYRDGFSMMIVGKSHNIVVAKEMLTYLINTLERLSKRYEAKDRVSYKNGASQALFDRLTKINVNDEDCHGLVVVEKAMVDDYLSNLEMTSKVVSTVSKSSLAYYKGVKDAQSISLNSQIESNKERVLI
jgi:hypothetical protein